MEKSPPLPLLLFSFLLLLLLCFFSNSSQAQQAYVANQQLDCNTNWPSTLGYSCNGPPACSSFLTFRSQPPYQSPVDIAYLLSADAANVSAANAVADVSPAPAGELVLVPVPCSCFGRFYQRNASYTLKATGENYLIVSNNTYQGLSACQAMMAQNPFDSRNLTVGDKLVVPLRCACPSRKQADSGTRYLLTYLVTWGDDVPTIAARFRADYQSVLDANGLSSTSTIFPFTTLLVPMKAEPTRDEVVTPPPPPASPPPPVQPVDVLKGGSGSNKRWVYVGVGVGVGFAALAGVLVWFLCRRRSKPIPKGPKVSKDSAEHGELLRTTKSAPLISSEVRLVMESLTVYKFGELEKATGFFGEDHKIRGSVYRGVINGDAAAIKRLKGDVSNEINVLKQINHSSVIRLSGFGLHEGNTYLVYEFAEKGSLSDWLHHKKGQTSGTCLSWKQRATIAHNVADGLNYLHNYTNPLYVHKNLKSSNVLLDGELRAKVANFGLARPVEDWEGPQLTRHVVGTHGYLAPEYLEDGLITTKLDVFAFGVVMLELLSGKEATFSKEGEDKGDTLLWQSIEPVLSGEDGRSKLRNFIDPCLQSDYPFDLAFAMAELARRCVAREPGSRPNMAEVLMSLSAIHYSTVEWDSSDYSKSNSMIHGR